MRPSTPLEAINAALASVESGTLWSEAEDLLSALNMQGWMVVPEVSLPTSAPKGDPKTAAERIEDLSDRQWAVWWLLAYRGPVTDEQLIQRYGLFTDPETAEVLPHQSDSSIRSRRAELVRAGHVEAVPGERRPTRNGSTAQVWRAVGSAQEVAA